MADLIDRQQAIDAVLRLTMIKGRVALDSVVYRIQNLPSAEPQERKTGEWINITTEESLDEEYKCSECGFELFLWSKLTNFCPNCGARMEGTDE